jgi:hypothetical protein
MNQEEAGENCAVNSVTICIARRYREDAQIKEDGLEETCNTHKTEKKFMQNFDRET